MACVPVCITVAGIETHYLMPPTFYQGRVLNHKIFDVAMIFYKSDIQLFIIASRNEKIGIIRLFHVATILPHQKTPHAEWIVCEIS